MEGSFYQALQLHARINTKFSRPQKITAMAPNYHNNGTDPFTSFLEKLRLSLTLKEQSWKAYSIRLCSCKRGSI